MTNAEKNEYQKVYEMLDALRAKLESTKYHAEIIAILDRMDKAAS